jgi:phosphohistidine phosphatase SixA
MSTPLSCRRRIIRAPPAKGRNLAREIVMRARSLLPALLLAGQLAATATPAFAQPVEAAGLAAALRAGGLVLYMRHPATEPGQNDAEDLDFRDCATQRNLSAAGRQVAAELGEALRRIGAPVRRAVTSEYCRARETAVLMGLPSAEVDGDLNDGGRMLAKGPGSPAAEALRAMLRSAVAGEIVLVVAHRPNLVDAAGPAFADLAEAEIVAFRPVSAPPGFAPLARIRPADWPGLTASR